ncbi:MAG TPA: hypothetical protein VIT65_08685 [Microlunatus sp.]
MNVPIFGEYAEVRVLVELAQEVEAAGWTKFPPERSTSQRSRRSA